MAHKHPVYDTDLHFTIDPISRIINNVANKKITVVQFDHNSERFSFDMPRYVEGHDMLLSNLVEVHYINIGTQPSETSSGVYVVGDLQLLPGDESTVTCSWLIPQSATQYAGALNFLLRFVCIDNGIVWYVWNTAIHTGIRVSGGMKNEADDEVILPEILEQWETKILNALTETYDMAQFAKNAGEEVLAAAKRGDYDGAKGDKGDPGVSVTHEWQGTTLKVTSASGTSSADLKGDKGDPGDTGMGLSVVDYFPTLSALKSAVPSPPHGAAYGVGTEEPYDIYIYGKTSGWVNNGHLQGVDGYTPIKGKDYWTEEDKREIVEDVIAEIPDVTDETNTYTNLLEDLETTINTMSDASGGGTSSIMTNETLKIENGILKVNTTDVIEADNDLPVTSAAVYAEFAAIEALLKTI